MYLIGEHVVLNRKACMSSADLYGLGHRGQTLSVCLFPINVVLALASQLSYYLFRDFGVVVGEYAVAEIRLIPAI
jgi:hypothetical protein